MLLNSCKINLDISRKDKHKTVSTAETRGGEKETLFFFSFSKISVKMENGIYVEVSESLSFICREFNLEADCERGGEDKA